MPNKVLICPQSSLAPPRTEASWDAIAGLRDVKMLLQEATVLPTLRPDLFQVSSREGREDIDGGCFHQQKRVDNNIKAHIYLSSVQKLTWKGLCGYTCKSAKFTHGRTHAHFAVSW